MSGRGTIELPTHPTAYTPFVCGVHAWGNPGPDEPLVLVCLVSAPVLRALRCLHAATCVACNGVGVSTRGGVCAACKGKPQPNVGRVLLPASAFMWRVNPGLIMRCLDDPTEFYVLQRCTEFLTTKRPVPAARAEAYIKEKIDKYCAPF